MKRVFKTFLPLLLIVVLLTASMPAFAASSSVTPKVIKSAHASAVVYNGKYRRPVVQVYDAQGKRVNSKYYTVELRTKSGSKIKSGKAKKVGTYKIKVTAKSPYTGKAYCNFYVLKKIPFTISVKKTVYRGKSYTIKAKNTKGAKISWSCSSSAFQISGGKLYVKSTAKKGKYTIKCTASGEGVYPYGKTIKYVTVTVK